ncbi:putative TNP2-like transposon protein [Cucumis melo var. makuwa]|uniref:TNP2-like transposon protein n=1 Tax=Cucumis melo var. makuwa TaxID=1194695 RepID=A0A5A7TAV0_CUCMM|nr:putative TNP2-like transposon protein [Cucumis melo var. makuwa]
MYEENDVGNIKEMVEIAHEQYSKDPSGFEKLLNDAEKPLYEGCKKFTKLSTLVKLYNLKVRHGWSNISFSELLKALKDILPSPNDLPTSMYEAKKMLGTLGMEYERFMHALMIVACIERHMPTQLCALNAQPRDDIGIYLEPLIDDLKLLWESGVQCYDAYNEELFNLRTVLLWTINDFPAYGNLSGCSVKGYHWSLVIINPYDDVVYHLDSLRTSSRDDIKYVTNMALTIFQSQKNLKKTRKTTFWKAVRTVECGYYVMRYMREIVSKDTSIITDAIDTRNSYSQLELDECQVIRLYLTVDYLTLLKTSSKRLLDTVLTLTPPSTISLPSRTPSPPSPSPPSSSVSTSVSIVGSFFNFNFVRRSPVFSRPPSRFHVTGRRRASFVRPRPAAIRRVVRRASDDKPPLVTNFPSSKPTREPSSKPTRFVDLLSVDSIEGHNQVTGKGFPTTGPRIEAGNVVIHRGLHVTRPLVVACVPSGDLKVLRLGKGTARGRPTRGKKDA